MSSCILAYKLRAATSLLTHGDYRSMLLADYERPCFCHQDLDAQVHSGDYFIMLATTLDELGKESN